MRSRSAETSTGAEVGCSRLVSSAQDNPRDGATDTSVPVNPGCPSTVTGPDAVDTDVRRHPSAFDGSGPAAANSATTDGGQSGCRPSMTEPSRAVSAAVEKSPACPATPPNAWWAFPSLTEPASQCRRETGTERTGTGYGDPVAIIRRSHASP